MNTKTKAATTTTPETAWDMACAVLTALHQTHDKAQTDYAERFKAAGGNPFAQGVGGAGHLISTLKPALRKLEADMHDYARANDLAMPKLRN